MKTLFNKKKDDITMFEIITFLSFIKNKNSWLKFLVRLIFMETPLTKKLLRDMIESNVTIG